MVASRLVRGNFVSGKLAWWRDGLVARWFGGEMVWWQHGLVARWFGGEMTVNLKTALTQSYASILEGAFP